MKNKQLAKGVRIVYRKAASKLIGDIEAVAKKALYVYCPFTGKCRWVKRTEVVSVVDTNKTLKVVAL